MLINRVSSLGIDTSCLFQDKLVPTTLAFVHTAADGERDFSFYRNPGADMMLTCDEVSVELIRNSKIFHFGTISMTHEEIRNATRKAVEIAQTFHVIISFDPNIREPLWNDLGVAKEQVSYGLSVCDILKISEDELTWYTNEEDCTKAVEIVRRKYNIPLILVSMGKKGSRAYFENKMVEVPAVLCDSTIDTTGAGDTFYACVLDYVLKHGLENFSIEELRIVLQFANTAAAIITTRRGALCVMPSREEIINYK